MKEAVIVTACRSAVGKAPRGILSQTRPEHMGVTVLKELIRRTPGLNTEEIEDVIIGCSFPEAQQGLNLGRVLATATGLPDSVPGMTVNRFCASGLQAIAIGAEKIMCGFADVVIAGGVESMSLIPWAGALCRPIPRWWTYVRALTSPWGLRRKTWRKNIISVSYTHLRAHET